MSEQHQPAEAIGTVTHWFGHLSVTAVRLTAPLAVGDRIHIRALGLPLGTRGGGSGYVRHLPTSRLARSERPAVAQSTCGASVVGG